MHPSLAHYLVRNAERFAAVASLAQPASKTKHSPGGKEHDQSTHGRRRDSAGILQENLPHESAVWHAMCRDKRSETIRKLATGHGMSVQQYTAMCDEQVTDLVQGAGMWIRMPPEHVGSLIEDGRFKTLYETHTSGGTTNEWSRKETENSLFQLSEDLPPHYRPIYGYASHKPDGQPDYETLDNYGDVAVYLKEHMRQRATFTMQDSLDATHAGREANLCARPLTAPTADAWCFALYSHLDPVDPLHYSSIDKESFLDAAPYVELQYHRGVTINDIAEMVYLNGTEPSASVQDRLQRAGIPYRVKED